MGDRVRIAEGIIGMAAAGSNLHLPTFRAHCSRDYGIPGQIEGYHFSNAALVVVHQLTDTFQISQTFFTAVEHQQHRFFGLKAVGEEKLGTHHQADHIGGVVPYAGGKELTVLLHYGQRCGVWKDHVGVGHVNGDSGLSFTAEGEQHVAGMVHQDLLCAFFQQPAADKFCPLLFVVRRGGDGSQFF